jgi:hypothetical protein
MKFSKPTVSYLHAVKQGFSSFPEPEEPSPRILPMVAHRPLKFSTNHYKAAFVVNCRKPRNRKPKKSPEDADFIPKVPKPPVTMPYTVNGYGTKNKAKALYRKSIDRRPQAAICVSSRSQTEYV